jgi:hypothetical protein
MTTITFTITTGNKTFQATFPEHDSNLEDVLDSIKYMLMAAGYHDETVNKLINNPPLTQRWSITPAWAGDPIPCDGNVTPIATTAGTNANIVATTNSTITTAKYPSTNTDTTKQHIEKINKLLLG